ncbi:Tat proofreading chaperone DmsD [Enterobacteriaceae bacterium H20N1]|uniref:Tat proofreading chaperone DmsD n=1 Tax=Dryocola boscaweniae TaxID=2925397 RepID=A0A9X2WB35_9ENTR|nr:Tat proofreading chaperone DmsD [Dryocola boscaweniae]MCT4703997.1 Tat proofreading chaperone DmsD [Dryocola boscaweniae]MCT4721165.1 Tat proofreading chaperone DmsD [Dryocola boscaweniae]
MSSQNSTRLATIALTGRVLGVLYRQSPQSQDAAPLYATLANTAWAAQWPVQSVELTEIAQRMADGIAHSQESLNEAYQRLFIGPYALPAAPWGSVYLDKENVLFGDSMLELRQWMRENGIAHQTEQNEPDDHIGTLLMLAAWLAEQGHQQRVDELLARHLLPWAGRFLELFTQKAAHPFYQGLGELTRLTLAGWREGLLVPVAGKELYY